jgi:hypothetical protein
MAGINLGGRSKTVAVWAWRVLFLVIWCLSIARPQLFEPIWRPVLALLFGVGGCTVIWMAPRDPSLTSRIVGSIVGAALVAAAIYLAVGVYECGVDFRGCK